LVCRACPSTMIQSLFILSNRGDVIIEKHWRGLINRALCDHFWEEVNKAESPAEVLPIISTSKYYLIHIQHEGLFFLAPVLSEISPLLVIDFLQRVIDVFINYFEVVNEDSLKDNFVTVYQLLDEMMDNGFPFTTEPNVLRDMIAPDGFFDKMKRLPSGAGTINEQLPANSTAATPWRSAGVNYTANEIYFDIIEELDCTIDSNGMMVTSEISGKIESSCRLSGMPDLTMTFNNPRIFDDCSFHPCVRYLRYEHDKVISFVPPDGNFQLMRYRVNQQVQPMVYCKPQITFGTQGGRVNVMAGPKNTMGKTIEDVSITIPFPKSVASTNLTATHGTVQYDEISKVAKWIIGKIPLDKSLCLSGSVNLQAGYPIPESPPILLINFKIAMYTASGLKIETLTLTNEAYKPFKGVRCVTKAGKFQVRS